MCGVGSMVDDEQNTRSLPAAAADVSTSTVVIERPDGTPRRHDATAATRHSSASIETCHGTIDDYRQPPAAAAVSNGAVRLSVGSLDTSGPSSYYHEIEAGGSVNVLPPMSQISHPSSSPAESHYRPGFGSYAAAADNYSSSVQRASLNGASTTPSSYLSISASTGYLDPASRPAHLIDSYAGVSLLPPYPQSSDPTAVAGRVSSYGLPPYAAAAPPPARTVESSSRAPPTLYGRSAFAASEAFGRDLFGQYLHDATPPPPLHPLPTHAALHDQPPTAGILPHYQQPHGPTAAAPLPTMPHGAGAAASTSSELFRRAYSAVGPDNPLKSQSSQHWPMSAAAAVVDQSRRGSWDHPTPPSSAVSPRYHPYAAAAAAGADTAMAGKRAALAAVDDMTPGATSVHYAGLSAGSVYSPGAGSSSTAYPGLPGLSAGSVYSPGAGSSSTAYPGLPSSQRQLMEDAYRQMAGEYRAGHPAAGRVVSPGDVYGSALASSLDRYYYQSARDAVYRAFIPPPPSQTPHYSADPRPSAAASGGGYVSGYGQYPSTYPPGFVCPPPPADKQHYLPPTATRPDYLDTSGIGSGGGGSDAYTRHSIYSMMPRYF